MRGLSNWLAQLAVVITTNLRTIPARLPASLTAAVGVAGVVLVLVFVLSIAEGFRKTIAGTGSNATALVMRSGTDTELSSNLSLDDARIVSNAPGVVRGSAGPLASAELFVVVDIPKRSTGTAANVPLRGVEPAAFEIRRDIKIVEGRKFESGRNEIIVGQGAVLQFAGLELGNELRWGENTWKVVGRFEAGGALWESEMWCDLRVLQPAYRRGNTIQSVYARLDSEEAFEPFKDALTTDPRLDVMVVRERDYFSQQSQTMEALAKWLGGIIASLMAVGAIFGAVLTMYSSVAARTREIATLRALGFSGGPVVLSVLIESLLLATGGGLAGGLAAYLAFNGYRAATLNFASFSQVSFAFAVTPRLIVLGLVLALVVGLLGGLLPALRAARLPISSALREL